MSIIATGVIARLKHLKRFPSLLCSPRTGMNFRLKLATDVPSLSNSSLPGILRLECRITLIGFHLVLSGIELFINIHVSIDYI